MRRRVRNGRTEIQGLMSSDGSWIKTELRSRNLHVPAKQMVPDEGKLTNTVTTTVSGRNTRTETEGPVSDSQQFGPQPPFPVGR
jgi:hypothetical protein